jgi:Fur family peroxide stress response transcriptional regulator
MQDEENSRRLGESLDKAGLRTTRQRELVYEVLSGMDSHPTAEQIHSRCREVMDSISLATVYNCLETLTGCGLVKCVRMGRESARFCPNLVEHAHFHDRETGEVIDLPLDQDRLRAMESLVPNDMLVESMEINFVGRRKPNAGNTL